MDEAYRRCRLISHFYCLSLVFAVLLIQFFVYVALVPPFSILGCFVYALMDVQSPIAWVALGLTLFLFIAYIYAFRDQYILMAIFAVIDVLLTACFYLQGLISNGFLGSLLLLLKLVAMSILSCFLLREVYLIFHYNKAGKRMEDAI